MDEGSSGRPQKSVPKRSLTPNRALFDSYDEAHRTIAGYTMSPYETYDDEDELPPLHGSAAASRTPTGPDDQSQLRGRRDATNDVPEVIRLSQATKTGALPSHYDDVKKRNTAQSGFNVTHLSGPGGVQYPLVMEDASSPTFSAPPSRREHEQNERIIKVQAIYSMEESTLDHAHGKGKSDDPKPNDSINKDDDPFGGFATNSDHSISEFYDAFEADRKYSFLCSPAEKEVSSALRQATGVSQPSSGQLFRSRDDQAHPIPAFDPAKFTSRLREEKAKDAERNKQAGSFYNSSAINSAWHMSDNEIKVPTSPILTHSSDFGTTEPQEPWSQIDLKDDNNPPGIPMPATSSVADHAQDWVTVSEEVQDGARRRPEVFMGRVLTGSSIANYSDHLLAINKPENVLSNDPRAIAPNSAPWWDKLPTAVAASQASRAGPSSRQHAARPIFNMPHAFPESGVHRALSKLSTTGRQSRYDRFDDQEGFEMQSLPKKGWRTSRNPFSWNRTRRTIPSVQTADGDNSLAPLVAARPLSNYDNLHFPLVALQDAQRIQAHRRASGLEDQATSGSFVNYQPMVSRNEQRTTLLTPPPRALARASSFYSTSPLSPNMPDGGTARSSYTSNPLRLTPVVTSSNTFRSVSVAERFARRNMLVPAGHLVQPHLTTRSATRRYQEGTDLELGRLAGRDSDYIPHQRVPLLLEAQKRQELFFLLTVIINVPLPFWGVAVLYGKMDSAVSWCTKGEAYGLAEQHRG